MALPTKQTHNPEDGSATDHLTKGQRIAKEVEKKDKFLEVNKPSTYEKTIAVASDLADIIGKVRKGG